MVVLSVLILNIPINLIKKNSYAKPINYKYNYNKH